MQMFNFEKKNDKNFWFTNKNWSQKELLNLMTKLDLILI